MAPKITREHREARRQQIIDSAAVCFAHNGFHKTTMQDICRQANVSPGAVYVYFDGKDQIIQAMCVASAQRNSELVVSARQEEETIDVFTELVEAFFALFDDADVWAHLKMTLQLWAEGARSGEIALLIQDEMQGVRASLTEIVRAAQRRGEVNSSLEPDAVAQAFISFFDGFLIQRTFDPNVDVESYKDVIKAMGLGGFWTGRAQKDGDPAQRANSLQPNHR